VRERILDATLELIATDGLDAVRHRRVADMAEVSPGSTTYHFASREDLVEAAFVHYLDQATAVLGTIEVPTARGDEPAETLASYVQELIDREFLDPGLVRAEYEMVLHATRTPTLARRLAEREDAQTAAIEEFLRSTGAEHPGPAARLVVAVVRGLEVERLINPARGADRAHRLVPMLAALWPDGQ
jgi:DNA-binding transcriptional regulator YbjK